MPIYIYTPMKLIGKLYLYMVRLQMGIYGYIGAYMGMCGYKLYTTGVCMGILWAYKGIQVCMNICLNTQKINTLQSPISVIPNLEDKTIVFLSPERNKPFKCKTILLF